jgi:hypothetical protein
MPGTWDRDAGRRRRGREYYHLPNKGQRLADSGPSPSQMIHTWLNACNDEHGNHCKATAPRFPDKHDTPSWLIDVVTHSIKKATPEDQYIALSYVWEDPSVRNSYMMLEKDVVESFKNSSAFWGYPERIPATVRDAIDLTGKLGCRYLWVDRFCIVQDDPETKEHQLQNMASIYANAYLTIIAGVGDATVPLQYNTRTSRSARQHSREELLSESKWAKRAWTLQELLFSRRAVFFLKNRIVWECHCDIWESIDPRPPVGFSPAKRCTNRFMGTATGLQQSPWPNMDEYSNIVSNYSVRSLTYDKDTVSAFLGITNVLSGSFTGGFIYGLPAVFLDIALLWRPKAFIQRKKNVNLPSWSWMGWDFSAAEVDLTLWKAASDYIHYSDHHRRGDERKRFQSPYKTKVRPTIKWFLGSLESLHWSRIENVGLHYQDRVKGLTSLGDLPQGWSENSNGFQHECDNHTLFKYPIPIQDHRINEPTNGSQYTPAFSPPRLYLSFSTTHAYFDIEFYCFKSPNPSGPSQGMCIGIAIANILTPSGSWAGHFRSHDLSLGVHSLNHDGKERLEFVAISEGEERNGSHVFDMEFMIEHMDDKGLVRFVNVLWIERREGVAYRRGLGHIVKSAWDESKKKEADIVLG